MENKQFKVQVGNTIESVDENENIMMMQLIQLTNNESK